MKIKPICNNKEYETYLNWVDKMFDKKIKTDSEEGQKLQVILMLIRHYEDQHFAIPVPDPIDAIKLKMQEKNLKNKDLEGIIGSKGYVSALLNKKKPLTIQTARTFHKKLGVSGDVLLA
jgi:HTH-type transcriptional regulator/antitoxin HigA